MRVSRIPAQNCVMCGYLLDASSHADGDALPSPGDFSICFGCGHITQFDEDLYLIPVTEEDFKSIDAGLKENLLDLQQKIRFNRFGKSS